MERVVPLALLVALLLPGCATVFEGTSESVAINTTPPGATCTIDRDGQRLGTVSPTPGSISVAKSKNDITVSCSLQNHQASQVSVSPKFVGTTFANILLGGVVGIVADAASGANFDLPDRVDLTMAPDPAAIMGSTAGAFGATVDPNNPGASTRRSARRARAVN
jgi:hypothetical protein